MREREREKEKEREKEREGETDRQTDRLLSPEIHPLRKDVPQLLQEETG